MSSNPSPPEPADRPLTPTDPAPVDADARPARPGRGGLAGFWLACLVAAAWSGFLLASYASGQAAQLLAEDFMHYPLFAGLILFVLAAHGLLSGPRPLGQGHGGAFEELIEPTRGHPMTWLGALILLLPLIVALRFDRRTFSLETVQRRGLDPQGIGATLSLPTDFDSQALDHRYPVDATGHRPLTLLDLVGASGDEAMRRAFTGQPVVVEGQLAPWPEGHGDPAARRLLYQLMMSCCAADSVPLTAELRLGEVDAAGPAEGEWARARGTIGFIQDAESGYWRPWVELTGLEAAPVPSDPFLQR